MKRLMFYMSMLFVITSCSNNTGFNNTRFNSVQLLSSDSNKLLFIDHPKELKVIEIILSNSKKIEYKQQLEFQYKLDFDSNYNAGRWLYNERGYLVKLNTFLKPCYKISNVNGFNKLLKINK